MKQEPETMLSTIELSNILRATAAGTLLMLSVAWAIIV